MYGRILAILLGSLASLAVFAAPVWASVGIAEFDVESTDTQAGGHPDLNAHIALENPGSPKVAKDLIVNLPEGLFGNPGAIIKCRSADFAVNQCAPGSQAGLVSIIANYEGDPDFVVGTAPVYNMRTVGDDESARLAFVAPVVNIAINIPIGVRSNSDYGLRMTVSGISQRIPLKEAEFTIWGFPADPSNDEHRFKFGSPGSPPGCPGGLTTDCNTLPYPGAGQFVRPYTNNPSICTGRDLPVTLEVTSYQNSDSSHAASSYPETTGCDKQKFDPLFNFGLTTPETDAPSGLDIKLRAEQFLEGTAPAQSNLRSASLTLPEGLTINPDAADGQTSCSDAQARFGSTLPGNCPDSAKIGTVDVRTPALEGALIGSLYIGEPLPGNQYRVFMIFDGFGVHAKLAASFRPDPETGQLTMSIADLPQVPFQEFNLHLFASDRGLVATPIRCGIYFADAELVPWNGTLSPQPSRPLVSVSSGPRGGDCPGLVRPFKPRLAAGTTHPLAGDFSSFVLKLDRDDGDQFLGDLTFRMPPGFTGDLRGIPYCGEAAIAAAARRDGRVEQAQPSCPQASQIGTTNVAAGPGEHPFHAVGRMYLAGPLKGAPLSLAAITPALAGPYDYGVVVVRVALHVDPQTAQVYAASDRVPSIIGGVPIRMRSIQVNIDRPRFTINPTSCRPMSVDSQGIGDQGTVTDFSSYFQVVNCARLGFKPRMTIRQVGGGTRRTKTPALKIDLRTRPGDANIRALSVTLPSAFEIDQNHLGNICSEKELITNDCAGRTAIGRAKTTTPLLDQPLSGPVYAVSGSGGLPRLAFILDGQVRLVPRAVTKAVHGRLRTTVSPVPDAPIGHFQMTVFGGKTGYLINTRNLCSRPPVTRVDYTAQNGKTRTEAVRVKASCKKKKSRKARR
jgi:hypothetical protein